MKKYKSIKSRIELLKTETIIYLMFINKIPYDEALKQFNQTITSQLLLDITTQFYDLNKENIIKLLEKEQSTKEFLNEIIKPQNNKMVNYTIEKIKEELTKEALLTNNPIEQIYYNYTHPKKKLRKR